MSAAPGKPRTMADFEHIHGAAALKLEDHRKWPLSRVLLYCTACGWARDYNPDAIAIRLGELKAGGYQSLIGDVARKVAWPCPACRRMNWVAALAYPKATDPREVARMARAIRS